MGRAAAAAAAYVHIPFCRRKCHYCDFAVHAIGSRHQRAASTDSLMRGYAEGVCREVRATARLQGAQGPLRTVYVGGGTPSLLPPPLLGRILAELRASFGLARDCHVTVEADPATFDRRQLEALAAIGATRLSVGVQAFQDRLLTAAGRTHGVADVHSALSAVAASPFRDSWSLDLMFGLPHQTLPDWRQSLSRALAAAPPHLSAYGLTLEPDTPWGRSMTKGVAPLPREDTEVEMFELAHEMLTGAGYEHYEVSNFARPGQQSRHNWVYWEDRPFLGFGVGATSCDSNWRVRRPRNIRAWERWVDRLEAGEGWGPELEGGAEWEAREAVDAVIAGMRTARGVSLESLRRVARSCGTPAAGAELRRGAPERGDPGGDDELRSLRAALRRWQASGRVRVEHERVRLTAPSGFLVADDVTAEVWRALE